MIDFRYHLVSIIAVFLALAVGIVLGTTGLNGLFLDGLRSSIDRLTSDKRALEQDVQDLRGGLRAADEFATVVGADVVRGRLEDQQVLLVSTPETPSDLAERLTPLLEASGAQVTGRLTVLPALSDPSSRQLLEDVVADVLPVGVEVPEGEPVDRAAAVLAAALGRQQDDDGLSPGAARAVLSAFGEADLLRYTADDEAVQAATVVVVLTGAAPGTTSDEALVTAQETLLTVASALDDTSGGVVVAGASGSDDEGGLVRVLRDDTGTAGRVSSVDNADRGSGLVGTVLALAEQARGGVGQYGAGAGVGGALPSPAP